MRGMGWGWKTFLVLLIFPEQSRGGTPGGGREKNNLQNKKNLVNNTLFPQKLNNNKIKK